MRRTPDEMTTKEWVQSNPEELGLVMDWLRRHPVEYRAVLTLARLERRLAAAETGRA